MGMGVRARVIPSYLMYMFTLIKEDRGKKKRSLFFLEVLV